MAKAKPNLPPISLNIAVLTVSDKRTAADDTAGNYLQNSLEAAGHKNVARAICPDNLYHLRRVLSDWICNDDIHIIITNGGTGFSHNKSTIAAITPLLDQTIRGFGELFRQLSYAQVGSAALQSDALAGTANGKFVFCVPGSPKACQLAWEDILHDQLNSTYRPCNFASHFID